MLMRRAGIGRWAAMLAFAGVAMTTFMASADTLTWDDTNAMKVEFEEPEQEPQSMDRDEPAFPPAEDLSRSGYAPASPVDPRNPSRRCGNLLTTLDMDDLCQYAQSTGTMVGPK